jgi:hypothetical protein
MSEFKFPTEIIELPSKGIVYPENNPLSSGKVEMKYMTAREEDIITNQLINHGDEGKIEQEIKGLQKINKESTSEVTVRLSHIITSINGSTEKKDIRDFVNNYFLAKDARAFRAYYNEVSPDIDLQVSLVNADGVEEDADLPIGINFFWPDA